MNTKSVQVVMSTYNGEKYLKEQIDSILSQEGVDVRLYIRDDGSSDRTTDILASYQEHKNVKIEKGNNLGFAKSFLTALDECDEADYYAFSDQDDVWEKDKLSTAIEILEEESQSTPLLYCSALQRVDENLNPLHVQSYHGLRINLPSMLTRGRLAGCTFVFNNTLRNLVKNANYIEKLYDDISESGADVAVPAFCISFENGDCAVDSRVKEVTTYSKKEALEVFLFNGYLTPCVASKMWKKSLWQKIRCPEGKLFEDQYTTYKLLMLANKIVFDPEVYYYYFKRSGSIGHSSFSKRTYDLLFGIGEQYQVITEAYPETTSTMKVARTVWELVFVNMMICSKYNDKETIGQVQKHARNAFLDVVTCKYLPAVRKAEIALFCFNFSAYRFIYIKYKSKKKIA